MVVAQDRVVELNLARVQAVVHMQVVEVEVEEVAVASMKVLDPVAGLAPAQAPVMKILMMAFLVDLLALAVPVVAVVGDKQPEVIMDLVAMEMVVVLDLALVLQLVILEMVMQMHVLMVVAVVADRAQMAGVEAEAALDLVRSEERRVGKECRL